MSCLADRFAADELELKPEPSLESFGVRLPKGQQQQKQQEQEPQEEEANGAADGDDGAGEHIHSCFACSPQQCECNRAVVAPL